LATFRVPWVAGDATLRAFAAAGARSVVGPGDGDAGRPVLAPFFDRAPAGSTDVDAIAAFGGAFFARVEPLTGAAGRGVFLPDARLRSVAPAATAAAATARPAGAGDGAMTPTDRSVIGWAVTITLGGIA
jgi:hypothetical protein